nr:MAG TPA_asm: putative ATPase involved in cell division [Caudoviricetes sp.]
MIRFVDVSAGYGTEQEPVFTHFSETIEDGEFVLVTGESGVGKSTFVRLLLCELLPLAGQVFVDGQDLSLLKRGQIPVYRRKLGVVFQDHRLIPDRSAYENVKLARLVAGGRRRDTDQMICSLFSLFGITELYKRYPNEMSGGQQQKVCLARAVMNYPRYLLADEPTGNLDPESSREIMKFFELVHRQGTTVIVVTHDLEAADGLACRRIELS